MRLLLPVAFGLQNLDDDALPVDRPSGWIEHAAFLLRVELEQRGGQRWTLRTRAQLRGVAYRFSDPSGGLRLYLNSVF